MKFLELVHESELTEKPTYVSWRSASSFINPLAYLLGRVKFVAQDD